MGHEYFKITPDELKNHFELGDGTGAAFQLCIKEVFACLDIHIPDKRGIDGGYDGKVKNLKDEAVRRFLGVDVTSDIILQIKDEPSKQNNNYIVNTLSSEISQERSQLCKDLRNGANYILFITSRLTAKTISESWRETLKTNKKIIKIFGNNSTEEVINKIQVVDIQKLSDLINNYHTKFMQLIAHVKKLDKYNIYSLDRYFARFYNPDNYPYKEFFEVNTNPFLGDIKDRIDSNQITCIQGEWALMTPYIILESLNIDEYSRKIVVVDYKDFKDFDDIICEDSNYILVLLNCTCVSFNQLQLKNNPNMKYIVVNLGAKEWQLENAIEYHHTQNAMIQFAKFILDIKNIKNQHCSENLCNGYPEMARLLPATYNTNNQFIDELIKNFSCGYLQIFGTRITQMINISDDRDLISLIYLLSFFEKIPYIQQDQLAGISTDVYSFDTTKNNHNPRKNYELIRGCLITLWNAIYKHVNEGTERTNPLNYENFNYRIEELLKNGYIHTMETNNGNNIYIQIALPPLRIYLIREHLTKCQPLDWQKDIFNILIKHRFLASSFIDNLRICANDEDFKKDRLGEFVTRLFDIDSQVWENFREENGSILTAGSRIIFQLSYLLPELVYSILEQEFRGKTYSDIYNIRGTTRRNIIFTLDRLLLDKTHPIATESLKLLFRLAVAENESFSNNATGQFIHTFQVLLSGTILDYDSRIKVLGELIADQSNLDDKFLLSRHLLIIKAFIRSFVDGVMWGFIGKGNDSKYYVKDDYQPENKSLFFKYWDGLLELLYSYLEANNSYLFECQETKKAICKDLIANIINISINGKRFKVIYELFEFMFKFESVKQFEKEQYIFTKQIDSKGESLLETDSNDLFHGFRIYYDIDFNYLNNNKFDYIKYANNKLIQHVYIAKENKFQDMLLNNYNTFDISSYINLESKQSSPIIQYQVLKDNFDNFQYPLDKLSEYLKSITESEDIIDKLNKCLANNVTFYFNDDKKQQYTKDVSEIYNRMLSEPSLYKKLVDYLLRKDIGGKFNFINTFLSFDGENQFRLSKPFIDELFKQDNSNNLVNRSEIDNLEDISFIVEVLAYLNYYTDENFDLDNMMNKLVDSKLDTNTSNYSLIFAIKRIQIMNDKAKPDDVVLNIKWVLEFINKQQLGNRYIYDVLGSVARIMQKYQSNIRMEIIKTLLNYGNVCLELIIGIIHGNLYNQEQSINDCAIEEFAYIIDNTNIFLKEAFDVSTDSNLNTLLYNIINHEINYSNKYTKKLLSDDLYFIEKVGYDGVYYRNSFQEFIKNEDEVRYKIFLDEYLGELLLNRDKFPYYNSAVRYISSFLYDTENKTKWFFEWIKNNQSRNAPYVVAKHVPIFGDSEIGWNELLLRLIATYIGQNTFLDNILDGINSNIHNYWTDNLSDYYNGCIVLLESLKVRYNHITINMWVARVIEELKLTTVI